MECGTQLWNLKKKNWIPRLKVCLRELFKHFQLYGAGVQGWLAPSLAEHLLSTLDLHLEQVEKECAPVIMGICACTCMSSCSRCLGAEFQQSIQGWTGGIMRMWELEAAEVGAPRGHCQSSCLHYTWWESKETQRNPKLRSLNNKKWEGVN